MNFRHWLAALELISLALLCAPAYSEKAGPRVLFKEDFSDISLPEWRGPAESDSAGLKRTKALGPGEIPALALEARKPVSGNFTHRLPAELAAGQPVLLEVWRKAENVRTGAKHYLNAKAMLSWKARSSRKPKYSSTTYSDFSGTFDWERHRYVMVMPKDLEWLNVTVGLQQCTGRASWAGLTVSIDPRFPSQQALDKYLAREQSRFFANLAKGAFTVTARRGGFVQVLAGHQYVPRKYWNAFVRKAVLDFAKKKRPGSVPAGNDFRTRLAKALSGRAEELEAGLSSLEKTALNDRVYEIASLRARVSEILSGGARTVETSLRAGPPESPVSPLIFGNNINTQNMTAPYDFPRKRFQEGFLERVRPMGITFLRYPGGCNADVFNWRDTIGPLDQRKDLINFHNGTVRGLPEFGVDEYLRFCEEEKITPVITTAFLRDRPENIDPDKLLKGVRHPYVRSFLKTAPERVQLAADWVEYCNGSAETPLGKLRARNGHPRPYRVKYWEIGNESYGPDRVGSCTAEEYARAFPAYVEAMKARDPTIKIAMNGCGNDPNWNDTLLRLAGKKADIFQIHIYRTPRVRNLARMESQPSELTAAMRLADNIPAILEELGRQMKKHLGKTLPVIVTEFGMGNAKNRELMVSITSPVLVADMWRTMIESPLLLGANKWCLYEGYWFSQVGGPTPVRPKAPYYVRPEQVMHEIYARCRGPVRLQVNNEQSPGAKAVAFRKSDSYGIVLISRDAAQWQSVRLAAPGAKAGKATAILLTAGHPLLGNNFDKELIQKIEFPFEYQPGQPLLLPASSVLGLIVPRL